MPVSACIPIDSSAFWWWPAEGSATDALQGLMPNPIGLPAYADGLVGEDAFLLDGTNAYRIPFAASMMPASGSFTVEAWVYVASDGNNYIFGKWGDTGPWAGRRSFNVQVYPGGKVLFALSDDARQSNAAFHQFFSADGLVPLNTWTHIGAVYDRLSGERRIYVNGLRVATRVDGVVDISDLPSDFSIGAQASSPTLTDFFFDGRIDALTYYHSALSDADMAAIHAAGNFGKCAPPSSRNKDLAEQGVNHEQEGLRLVPNPSQGLFSVVGADPERLSRVLVFDAQGRALRALDAAAALQPIDLRGLPCGTYAVQVWHGEHAHVRALILQ